MKLTGLISGKAHDLGQRFSRPPRARVALVTGLATIALLGGTVATAQASMMPSAAAHVVTAKASTTVKPGGAAAAVNCSTSNTIVDEHNGSRVYSYVPGNGNVNLYFDGSGAATDFCYIVRYYTNGDWAGDQLYAKGTSVCLALDASTTSIHEGSATACSGGASYTLWYIRATSNASYFLYQSNYNGNDCIYDDTQRPVTYSGCNTSNKFEWLTLPSS